MCKPLNEKNTPKVGVVWSRDLTLRANVKIGRLIKQQLNVNLALQLIGYVSYG